MNVKKVKYRLLINFEKEEKWINEMSKQGWHLEKFFIGRFTFSKGIPGRYIYRNEYLFDKNKEEKKEYIAFLEESGIEVVHESAGWIYTRKKTVDGDYEIFSDIASKKSYYDELFRFMVMLLAINGFLALSNLTYFKMASALSWLNIAAGVIGATVCILLLFPIRFLRKERKLLEEKQKFSE